MVQVGGDMRRLQRCPVQGKKSRRTAGGPRRQLHIIYPPPASCGRTRETPGGVPCHILLLYIRSPVASVLLLLQQHPDSALT